MLLVALVLYQSLVYGVIHFFFFVQPVVPLR